MKDMEVDYSDGGEMFGIQKTCMTPYHPQSDGLVEHFNRTL